MRKLETANKTNPIRVREETKAILSRLSDERKISEQDILSNIVQYFVGLSKVEQLKAIYPGVVDEVLQAMRDAANPTAEPTPAAKRRSA